MRIRNIVMFGACFLSFIAYAQRGMADSGTDLFEGAYVKQATYDNNIKDGVILSQHEIQFVVTRSDPDDLTFTYGNNSVPVLQSGNRILNSTETGINDIFEVVMLSDGTNKALALIGQIPGGDRENKSFDVACWSEASGTGTVSFAGEWSVTSAVNGNLRDSETGEADDDFSPHGGIMTITSSGESTINVSIPNTLTCADETLTFTLHVSGNEATLLNAPVLFDQYWHTFKMVSDGSGLSMYMVASEQHDPSDVKIIIGVGTTISFDHMPQCATVDSNLNLTIPCAEYSGIQFGLYLERYVSPSDPLGIYWKLGSVNVK